MREPSITLVFSAKISCTKFPFWPEFVVQQSPGLFFQMFSVSPVLFKSMELPSYIHHKYFAARNPVFQK